MERLESALPREQRAGALKGIPNSALLWLTHVESLSLIRLRRVLSKFSPLHIPR